MSAVGALVRRPAILVAVFPLAAATVLAPWDLPNGPLDVVNAARTGIATDEIRVALWRLATLLPAAAGWLLSFSTREIRHSAFSWSLPELSRRLQVGTFVAGAIATAPIVALMIRTSGVETGVAGFGWGLLCFALGGSAFDPVLSKLESRSVPILIGLLAFRPHYVDQLFAIQPLALGALAAAAAWLILRRDFSRSASRRRPLAEVSPQWSSSPSNTRQYWARRSTNPREWNGSLATNDLIAWVRAGIYETFAGRRGGLARLVLFQTTFVTLFGYFLEAPHMAVVFLWIYVGTIATQMRTVFLYPIGRGRRATLFFVSTFAETLAFAALALGMILLIFALGLRGGAPLRYDSVAENLMYLVFFVVWAPLAHWPKLRGSWAEMSPSPRSAIRHFVFLTAYMLLAMGSAALFQRIASTSLAVNLSAVVAFGLATFAIYWVALRRYYRTADLLVARA